MADNGFCNEKKKKKAGLGFVIREKWFAGAEIEDVNKKKKKRPLEATTVVPESNDSRSASNHHRRREQSHPAWLFVGGMMSISLGYMQKEMGFLHL
ncbi:hypothetical protein LOK49_LG10G00971 [Camellia lanceoleosa]|uniref:Uncharacterized protein n=1 Tax=Camellia lanceoleosa TaxID=1840588 RepID=A0ACC0GAG5_9ERIC|nr:hypothetical protein LOK49_LG10G00971 [Camellia lanceoleosa]